MEQQKIKINPLFPFIPLMFQWEVITKKALIPAKINRKDNDNYSKVFEGLASLCFRKRKPCQNPVPALESTFFFDKFHCQTPQNPCSLSTLQIININPNSKFKYNGKYSF